MDKEGDDDPYLAKSAILQVQGIDWGQVKKREHKSEKKGMFENRFPISKDLMLCLYTNFPLQILNGCDHLL